MSEEIEVKGLTRGEAMGISIKGIVGSGKDGSELAMSTYVDASLPREEIDHMLDKIMFCVQRQRIVGDIPFLVEQINHCEKSINSITEAIARDDRIAESQWEKQGKHGNVKLKQAEKQRRDQQLVDLNGWQTDLEGYQKKLKEAEVLLAEGEVEQGKAVKSA